MILELYDEGVEDGDEQQGGPDVESNYGDPVWLQGRYEVDPIRGGKRFQGAWLVLDDGTRYVIAYRPVPEHFPFLAKRVLIQGRPYTPGRDTQHIQASHLEVQSIELAPGETPYPSPPTELPAPPVARTAAELAAHDGHWVQVIGTLESVRDDPKGYLGIARLRLADGTQVQAQGVRTEEWACHEGKLVTVTSRVTHSESGGPVTFELIGTHAICRGEVARCGMD